MKKRIFLSFRPEFFRPILYGMKKYEYRKRFCKEETTAYLYLSSPIKEVIGVMELGERIELDSQIKNFKLGTVEYERVKTCLENGEEFAIPIISLKLYKEPISINKIKDIDSNFFVPQSYLDLSKKPEILEFLNSSVLEDVEFVHDHNNIYIENIGMSCKEMELTPEFDRIDKKYSKCQKYNKVKSGYINK